MVANAISIKPGAQRLYRRNFVPLVGGTQAPRTSFCRIIDLARVDGWPASFQTQ